MCLAIMVGSRNTRFFTWLIKPITMNYIGHGLHRAADHKYMNKMVEEWPK